MRTDGGRSEPGRPDPGAPLGRHRHGRPGSVPATPASGGPAVPSGRRRHGRPDEADEPLERAAPRRPVPMATPTDRIAHTPPPARPRRPAETREGRTTRARAVEAPRPAGHGHGHGHGPATPVGGRVRVLIAALLVPCALAALVGVVVLWPRGPQPAPPAGTEQPVHGVVTSAQAADCSPGSGDKACAGLVIHMTDGPLPGRDLVQIEPIEPGTPKFSVGDEIVLGWNGSKPDDPGSYRVADFQRGGPLWWLAAIFAAAVLVLGRWRGLAALVALALSFGVLLFFVLPSILDGHDPLSVAVVGAAVIMFMVLYLTHGLSARTSTAVLGTLVSLGLIGALSAVFSVAAKLTGLDEETKNLIASLNAGVDARGLLLAGFVIGALGVLDDVTVTQTSAVWELHAANPELGARGLFAAAMRIGRDHVSSAVNTLVLAYAGASLPLMLLFTLSGQPIGTILTEQDVAAEIVRTLVGSIGLVASVPVTTALAALVASREKPAEPPS